MIPAMSPAHSGSERETMRNRWALLGRKQGDKLQILFGGFITYKFPML